MENDPMAWPFGAWLRLAIIRFGLTPASFWDMSVLDWLTLIVPAKSDGMKRADLLDLIKTYPDRKTENE